MVPACPLHITPPEHRYFSFTPWLDLPLLLHCRRLALSSSSTSVAASPFPHRPAPLLLPSLPRAYEGTALSPVPPSSSLRSREPLPPLCRLVEPRAWTRMSEERRERGRGGLVVAAVLFLMTAKRNYKIHNQFNNLRPRRGLSSISDLFQ
jgi:hypothetical protein